MGRTTGAGGMQGGGPADRPRSAAGRQTTLTEDSEGAGPRAEACKGGDRPAPYELRMRLENCHGIGLLDHSFRFPAKKQHIAIYASNGTMKSSLAKTLKAIAADDPASPPRDDIYPERKSVYDVLDRNGERIDPGSILVIESYESVPNAEDMAAGILVNEGLRDRYMSAILDIAEADKDLMARLSDRSGVKQSEIEGGLMEDFGAAPGGSRAAFYGILEDALKSGRPRADLADVRYQTLFNAGTSEIWSDPDFVRSLGMYIEKYDMLVEDSPYLSKRFNHTGANSVKKALDDAGFFQAEHVVGMRPKKGGEPALKDSAGLKAAIKEDMDRIEEGLRDEWAGMDKVLARNKDRRSLRAYLSDNRALVPRLGKVGKLKQDLWMSYMAQERDAVGRAVGILRAREGEIKEIIEAAGRERGAWEDTIERFHRRFDVPFRMHVANKPSAVVGLEAPRLAFTHHEGPGGPGRPVERDQLDKALSMGEKKAFFTLSALFAIRKKTGEGCRALVVLDDIVDSFDYKNKYAVVEYLKELSDDGKLHLLILTHNFDFLRTIHRRGVVGYDGCLFVERDEGGAITIGLASQLNNPLAEIMKNLRDRAKIVASIPFARNIVEYTRGKDDPDYSTLSDMLHWRPGKTDKIPVSELDRILRAAFKRCIKPADCPHDLAVSSVVLKQGDLTASSGGEADLYGKVTLSIATRMRAERFITAELGRRGQAPAGEHPGTHQMINDYKKHCNPAKDSADRAGFDNASSVLDRVSLMTPEVIHLNSFMYEPILDMSGRHLSELYRDVRRLDEGAGSQ